MLYNITTVGVNSNTYYTNFNMSLVYYFSVIPYALMVLILDQVYDWSRVEMLLPVTEITIKGGMSYSICNYSVLCLWWLEV